MLLYDEPQYEYTVRCGVSTNLRFLPRQYPPDMLFPLSLAVVALTVVGLVALVRGAFAAPHGVEDERGFQLTAAPKTESSKETETVAATDLVFFHR